MHPTPPTMPPQHPPPPPPTSLPPAAPLPPPPPAAPPPAIALTTPEPHPIRARALDSSAANVTGGGIAVLLTYYVDPEMPTEVAITISVILGAFFSWALKVFRVWLRRQGIEPIS